MQEVVTSKGAYGQPCEGSTPITAMPLRGRRDPGFHFSGSKSLRFGVKRAVLERDSDAGRVARGTVEAFFDHDSLLFATCREIGACVSGYRRRVSVEVSCCSVAEFNAYFYRTEWERVASRRGKSVQRTVRRFCGDLGGRRAYILNRE